MKKLVVFTAIALSWGAMAFPARGFTHPGLPFTTTDLTLLKANITAGKEPWKSGYAALAADSHSSLGYGMQGPFANVSRNPNVNLNQWRNDMIAIYDLARMWYFTGNTAYAQKAHDILIAWANTQTSFTGIEANLDLGDYAFRFGGGADILRSTWPGWTAADTTAVQNLFANVYWPATGLAGPVLGPTNKASLSLAAGAAVAVFCDDQAKLDKVVSQMRSWPATGFRNSLSNGEHGETGRDEGHSYAHLLSLGFVAEVLWKQGIDVYSEFDNRLLAMGEYFARFNVGADPHFVSMGTTDEYYQSIWVAPGWGGAASMLDILKSAYVLRKGQSAPWMDRKLATLWQDGDAFMYVKSADGSTATPPAAITFPSASLVSTGLTNADIGGASPAGSGTYSNGIWTVTGQGNDIWTHGAEAFHYVYKQITGDCTMIAKVESLQDLGTNNKAGLMIRSDLNATPACMAWVALKPTSTVETYFHGWTNIYGGSNWEAQGYWISNPVWWVKVERFGNLVTTYASPDGKSWAVQATGTYDNLGASPYIGLCVSSNKPGTLCTATFSNVSVTGGNGVAPVAAPAAPLSFLAASGENKVPLRWTESFGATSYKVKRSTISGSGYTTIATVTNPSYVDAAVTNSTTYYYVVSAVNSVGEGANSAQDSATPVSPALLNIAFSGTATASADNPANGEGAAQAFDGNTGTKWFDGAASTGWLQYDFGSGYPQTIKRYTVASANDMSNRDPKNWLFLGSNDGSTWTTLDTQSNQAFAARYQTNTYSIATPGSYRYYRLNVTANNGNTTSLQLSELGLFTDTGRIIPDGTYRLFNRNSNKAFDVVNGNTGNGSAIVQWSPADSSNSQKWTLTYQGNGQYEILGVASGKAAAVSGADPGNGAWLIIWPWYGGNEQKWTVTQTGDGFFKLTAAHSGKVADVNGGSTADGTNVIQYPYGSGLNQQWWIAPAQ